MTTTPTTGRVSSGWGKRKAKIPGMTTFHRGVDIAGPAGTPVVAPQAGIVTTASCNLIRGRYVIVDHGRYQTLSQHLSKRTVVKGQHVEEGQQIGLMGRTGNVTGVHDHTEVRDYGTPIDPTPWYAARGVTLGVPGSAVLAEHVTAPTITSEEDDDMRIMISKEPSRGYWLIAPGFEHLFGQSPLYPEEYDAFVAQNPRVPVFVYENTPDGWHNFDRDKAIFTQRSL